MIYKSEPYAFYGKSTEKPTPEEFPSLFDDNLVLFYELDTGNIKYYDTDRSQWGEYPTDSGGGGGTSGADWDAAEGESGYIANKPFYSEVAEISCTIDYYNPWYENGMFNSSASSSGPGASMTEEQAEYIERLVGSVPSSVVIHLPGGDVSCSYNDDTSDPSDGWLVYGGSEEEVMLGFGYMDMGGAYDAYAQIGIREDVVNNHIPGYSGTTDDPVAFGELESGYESEIVHKLDPKYVDATGASLPVVSVDLDNDIRSDYYGMFIVRNPSTADGLTDLIKDCPDMEGSPGMKMVLVTAQDFSTIGVAATTGVGSAVLMFVATDTRYARYGLPSAPVAPRQYQLSGEGSDPVVEVSKSVSSNELAFATVASYNRASSSRMYTEAKFELLPSEGVTYVNVERTPEETIRLSISNNADFNRAMGARIYMKTSSSENQSIRFTDGTIILSDGRAILPNTSFNLDSSSYYELRLTYLPEYGTSKILGVLTKFVVPSA